MRITYRNANNKDYWAKRWEDIPADNPMENANVYPLKYSELTVKDKSGKILEAGCGAGRILRHYHNKGYDINGFDFIDVAVEKLKHADPTLQVEVGDITNLCYADQSYKYLLAFGLYHNLENNLDKAISETYRVLKKGGKVCASFRADNIQTKLTDWLADHRTKDKKGSSNKSFHKRNLTKTEFANLFKSAGFNVEAIYSVENMPILYKFSLFRSAGHKKFDENKARSEGYQLSWYGKLLQNIIMKYFSDQFCNIYVIIASK